MQNSQYIKVGSIVSYNASGATWYGKVKRLYHQWAFFTVIKCSDSKAYFDKTVRHCENIDNLKLEK